jgi:cell division cycle 14
MGKPIEIIQDKLYWVSDIKPPQNFKNAFFFNIDNDLTYFPFNKDFGPLNLAMVHRYSRELARLLRDKNYSENRIFHYCSAADPGNKMVNGAFLMGAFMIVILKMTAEQAHEKFRPYASFFKSYRDASKGDCFYNCTLLHCLQGLEYAIKFGWYDFKQFNVKEYEYYERVENGDLNWIVPGKFVAFMGPIESRDAQHRYGHHPNKYSDIFNNIGVSRVIRLNEPKYNKEHFEAKGVAHNDLFFVDGSNPPNKIVEGFFDVVENHFANQQGAIAIHCKAGLGRTGTLIGLWAMKHFQIPAEAFIGWIRIARPGSILGP